MGTKAKSGDEASFPSTLSRKGGGEFGGQSPPIQGTKLGLTAKSGEQNK